MTSSLDRLFDHDHVRMLLAIAEAKSFSGAAAQLGVTQPSISQQVKRIEQAAGRRLFRRTSTGVQLTGDGEAVLVYARATQELAHDLKRHFRDTASPVKLSIGMSEVFCRTALPTVLWLFLREHPTVEMRIVSGPVETMMAAVEAHTVDFAVMRRHPAYPDVTPLWSGESVWIGRPDLALPVQDPVPLVLPTSDDVLRESILSTLQAHRRTWRIPFEALSFAGVISGMIAGLGVCAAPRALRLFSVHPLDPSCGLPALPDAEFVMTTPRRGLSGPVAAFAAVLREAAAASFQAPGAPLP